LPAGVCLLPYVQSWYDKYRDHGLVVIGVHSPEFAFEKEPANVQHATAVLGVTYPVALDTDEQGYGRVDSQRLYQLIRQSKAVREHDFSSQFQDDGVTVYAFTFG
jgi:glutathione peroxidase-family protein